MDRASQVAVPHEVILGLALSGQPPRELAGRFGVTEWTIKRWVARARRREQAPYWRQVAAPTPGHERN